MKLSSKAGNLCLIFLVISAAALFHSDRRASAENSLFASKTWDGGGTTNNWSEAANWSDDIAPGTGDDVIFDATSTKNATIDTSITVASIKIDTGYSGVISQSDAASITVSGCSGRPCFLQSSGTFNGSANTITLNSGGFGAFRMLGGAFNGGSGNISLPNGPAQGADFSLLGGTFRSTSGTLTIAGHPTISNAGTVFLHNNGTVTLTAVQQQFFSADSDNPTITFNNLNINSADGVNYDFAPRMIVEGDLSLNDGSIGNGNNGTVIEARGGFSVSQNFDGGIGRVEFGAAAAPRTITLVTGIVYPNLRLNDPNLTVDTSGSGTLTMPHQLNINQGVFNQGSVDMTINALGTGGGTCLVISGGTFNGSDKTITLAADGFGSILMTGGTFNGGSGNITPTGTGTDIRINGGAFKSTSGNLTVPGLFQLAGPSSTFLHNNGTVTFTAVGPSFISGDSDHLTITFNNVNINLANGINLGLGAVINVLGNLNLNDGTVGQAGTTIVAQGAVVVGANFDGGPTNITFGGSANQTFTNNGGANPAGTWTVNKSAGTVTAATSVLLQPTQPLNITGGTLFLGANSSLTAGAINVGGSGKLAADSSQTITLGGNLVNNGKIDLLGGGAACPENDTILIRSSVPGIQRLWSGSGGFRLSDVDIQDQAGSANITVFTGTNSGNNGSNFTFSSACPTSIGISPLTTSVISGTGRIFESIGGIGTRTFTLLTNNSGASITNAGAYTAGGILHVTDTIRVTDSIGDFADATVFVTGPLAKMAFVQQPTTASVNQSISPSIKVAMEDQDGFVVESATNTVVLSIVNNPSGATLGGTKSKDPVAGIATFDDISIDTIGTGYTLRAGTNPSTISRPTSDPFDIVAGTPAGLAFAAQPSDSITGQAIAPAVQVSIVDSLGNIVTSATNAVTIAIANNPGGSTLSGTTTVNAVNGVATFADLSLNKPGKGYTLSASSSGLAGATSSSFDLVTPFTVTNTNDSGVGSLRQAIINANATPGRDRITFAIAGNAPFFIGIVTQLPTITDSVAIDATTQPGYIGSPVVELVNTGDFSNLGLGFTSSLNDVRGLSITMFDTGMILSGEGINTVRGNWIGFSVTGFNRPNLNGIEVFSDINEIGGSLPGEGNIISGNNGIGVLVGGNQNTIDGNFIGTDPRGTAAVSNTEGIRLAGNTNNIAQNVISGNTDGVNILSTASDNRVDTNLIGLDAIGTGVIGNTHNGILVQSDSAVRNLFTRNRIFGNGRLGIRLGSKNGVLPLPNDPQDTDSGPNDRMNYPVLASAQFSSGLTTIIGTYNGTPSAGNVTFDFYSSPSCDGSGHGEGETYVGSVGQSIDATGIMNINFGFGQDLSGRFITATATDPARNTSEFSNCVQVQPRHKISGHIAFANNQPAASVMVFATNSATGINKSTLTESDGNYSLTDLPEGQGYVVTPSKAGLSFTPPQSGDDDLTTDRTFNFTAIQNKFSIGGRVQANVLLSRPNPGSNSGLVSAAATGPFSLGDVIMTLSGAANRTTVTDSSGRYNFGNLLPGNYTVTLSKTNYTFSPPSASFIVTTQNITQDFLGNSPGLDLLSGRITFDSDGSIKAMNANGTGLVTLIPQNRLGVFSEPDVTPDGLKITYTSTRPPGIFTANSDNTDQLNIRRASSLHEPVWSPDGSKVAFFDSSDTRLKSMNADGSNVTTLRATCAHPDWSSDSVNYTCVDQGSLIFSSGHGDIYLGSGVVRSPKFSPDGSTIAFIDAASPQSIKLINTDGSNLRTILAVPGLLGLAWSPDGTRLAYIQQIAGGGASHRELIAIFPVTDPDQHGPLTIDDNFTGTDFDWSLSPGVSTPSGSNVTVGTGGANVTFPTVGSAGTTVITPISPASAGVLPNGFLFGGQAFDISTTAIFTPLITVCFTMPGNTTLTQFNQTFLLHNENGILVNRTSTRNFATKQVCGLVSSLSPFVLAEQVDTSQPSISGLVLDTDGNPLAEVPILLSGTEERETTTDEDGQFVFANLSPGGNYNAQPKLPGYLFTENNQDFVSVNGENSVVFLGSPGSINFSGKVVDGGGVGIADIDVFLSGSSSETTTTDANGNYSFTNLPIDGTYIVAPFNSSFVFTPDELISQNVISDITGQDFTALFPTAARVSITGKAATSSGVGIARATVRLIDSEGYERITTTSAFGNFQFDNVTIGRTYSLQVTHPRYHFQQNTRFLAVLNEINDLQFIADPK
jgi:hypothetical protein